MPYRIHKNANAAPRAERRPPRRRARPDRVEGVLVALDPAAAVITLRVDEARARGVVPGEELVVDVFEATLRVGDGDGDGRPGLTDLFPGDRVRLELKRRVPGAARTATRLEQLAPGPTGGLRRLWRDHPPGS